MPLKPYQAPDVSAFIDLANHSPILPWFNDLTQYHGSIRFVGLRTFRGQEDVPVRKLFVDPGFAAHHIAIDTGEEALREIASIETALAEPRLMVLADPGLGKSTLIHWLTYCVVRGFGFFDPKLPMLDTLAPFPMVVRELPLTKSLNWDQLLDLWLGLPQNKQLDRNLAQRLLALGQVLMLLDGIDELADHDRRRALRDAVWEGMNRYPSCRFLLTSRLVGYDEVSFHSEKVARPLDETHLPFPEERDLFPRVYLAPMDEPRLNRLARSWFRVHEGNESLVEQKTRDLIHDLKRNEGTRRLMRSPLLLTYMAQIQKVRGALPEGRVQLYDEITESYLDSIDQERKLPGLPLSLSEKYRLMSRVGFEMQLRRSQDDEGTAVLVDSETLAGWFNHELQAMGKEEMGSQLVDYMSRRSGLLLPRGQDQYTWLHLSIGEYFAARHLEDKLMAPAWLLGGRQDPHSPYGQNALQGYGDTWTWRETLVLLFERLSSKEGWSDLLLETLWDGLTRVEPEKNLPLLAEILVDRYSGISEVQLQVALRKCIEVELLCQNRPGRHPLSVAFPLLRQRPDFWDRLIQVWQNLSVGSLHLEFSPDDTGWDALTKLHGLKHFRCYYVNKLDTLATISTLEQLWIMGPSLEDVRPLKQLTSLSVLFIKSKTLTDVRPLAMLKHLRFLYLSCSSSADLSPLKALERTEIILPDGRLYSPPHNYLPRRMPKR